MAADPCLMTGHGRCSAISLAGPTVGAAVRPAVRHVPPQELRGQEKNFDHFVAFDKAKCTVCLGRVGATERCESEEEQNYVEHIGLIQGKSRAVGRTLATCQWVNICARERSLSLSLSLCRSSSSSSSALRNPRAAKKCNHMRSA